MLDKSGKSKPEEILSNMESILEKLVSVAEEMHQASQQKALKEELRALQDRQNALVEQLQEADAALQGQHYSVPAQGRVRKLLKRFQELNKAFISTLEASKGVIPLELRHIRKE